eukprot:CAMPEP_0113690810 /NCGR_PEP_ID=MMETSP0038_2-20120614/18024_1 /TAXON_ID=2898 /ORGANISM="Cryptomonas paramecium" /LENGTH=646 /DNA_ID=CAMNT_0000612229 /DNA_START=63 /DNA_END=2003 /DNA_ORIENTATION=+ /assembly_acc=CAM_ASM_000170
MGSTCSVGHGVVDSTPITRAESKRCRYSKLVEAASDGSVFKVLAILSRGADIHSADCYGRTALHLAACKGHAHVVWMLLKGRADPNASDRDGNTPLQEAILNEHKNVVDVLVKAGASLSEHSAHMLGASLRMCVRNDEVHRLKAVVESGQSAVAFMELLDSIEKYATDTNKRDSQEFLRGLHERKHRRCSVRDLFVKKVAFHRSDGNIRTLASNANDLAYTLVKAAPRQIMAATLQGKLAEPIKKPMVSLFFSDIVSFTTISSSLSPIKVTRMLNNLFLRLDRLAYIHGVQKIDVVGDAYIAAANFTEDQPGDHAARLARFALDAVATAELVPVDEDAPDGRRLQIRAGLHCGPLEAYVTESAAFKYTLLGETVATASRMESSGAPGRVQCSAAMARLISAQAHDLALFPRPHCRLASLSSSTYLSLVPEGMKDHPPVFALGHMVVSTSSGTLSPSTGDLAPPSVKLSQIFNVCSPQSPDSTVVASSGGSIRESTACSTKTLNDASSCSADGPRAGSTHALSPNSPTCGPQPEEHCCSSEPTSQFTASTLSCPINWSTSDPAGASVPFNSWKPAWTFWVCSMRDGGCWLSQRTFSSGMDVNGDVLDFCGSRRRSSSRLREAQLDQAAQVSPPLATAIHNVLRSRKN